MRAPPFVVACAVMCVCATTRAQEVPPEASSGAQAPSTAASADDGRSPIDGVVGHIGFGYFTGDAPLGVRYWIERDLALDLGVTLAFASTGVTAQRYGLELGLVKALAHYHYSVVFARLGAGTIYRDTGEAQGTVQWDVNGSAFVGAELFLGALGFPNVSLQGGYGVQFNYVNQGGSSLVISTVNGGLSVVGAGTVGFHIYW
jgi:hypothetical protein